MKTLFIHLVSCWFLLTAQAQSASFPSEIKINSEFVTEQLSADRLRGFEYKAKQKLNDLMGYISLVSNGDYDKELRQHAAERAVALFERQQNWVKGAGCSGKCTAQSLFSALLASNKKWEVKATDVALKEPLQLQNNAYKGVLTYKQQCSSCSNNDTYEIDVWLQKVEKQFGSQREWVWEIRLGDVR